MNPTLNARGGINKTSRRERTNEVLSGSTGTSDTLQQVQQPNIAPIQPITPEQVTGNVPVIDTTNVTTGIETPQIEMPQAPQVDQFTQEQQQKAEAAKTAEAGSFEDYIAAIAGAPTKESLQAEQYAKFGVDEKQLAVDRYQTQLVTEQDRLRTKMEDIQRKGGGLAGGAQAEMANLERESLSKQADIALLQLAAQDQLDYASTVANRAVDAAFSRSEKINETLGIIYSRNKELFTQEEQRLFETKQADRERKLADEKDKQRRLLDAKAESMRLASANNAPQSVIDAIGNAQSVEDVISVGGQYGSTDLLDRAYKQAQIAGVYDQINARALAAQEKAEKIKEEAKTEKEIKEAEKDVSREKALGIWQMTQQLKDADGLNAAVGFGFKKSIIGSIPFASSEAVAGSDRADFEALAKRTANMLTLDNLKLMSGVLSETDIKILESAGSNLANFGMSEDAYLKEIQRVQETMERNMSKLGISEEQAAFYGVYEDSDASEIDNIFNTQTSTSSRI